MGALSSLSKSATLICWYVAVDCTFGFGALFLWGWLSEEFATSEKWKKRRKLLIVMAIIGVAGEQLATLADIVLSEHLQTIGDREIAGLKQSAAPRSLTAQQAADVLSEIQNAGTHGPVGIEEFQGVTDAEPFGRQLYGILQAAHWNPQAGRATESRTVVGVLVEVLPETPISDRIAAQALVTALSDQHVVVSGPWLRPSIVYGMTPDFSPIKPIIFLVVGDKP